MALEFLTLEPVYQTYTTVQHGIILHGLFVRHFRPQFLTPGQLGNSSGKIVRSKLEI